MQCSHSAVRACLKISEVSAYSKPSLGVYTSRELLRRILTPRQGNCFSNGVSYSNAVLHFQSLPQPSSLYPRASSPDILEQTHVRQAASTMTDSKPPFEYPASLEEYMVPEQEFLRRNPQISTVTTGIVVFDSEGKILLVQRAVKEKSFPNRWACPPNLSQTALRQLIRIVGDTGREGRR